MAPRSDEPPAPRSVVWDQSRPSGTPENTGSSSAVAMVTPREANNWVWPSVKCSGPRVDSARRSSQAHPVPARATGATREGQGARGVCKNLRGREALVTQDPKRGREEEREGVASSRSTSTQGRETDSVAGVVLLCKAVFLRFALPPPSPQSHGGKWRCTFSQLRNGVRSSPSPL